MSTDTHNRDPMLHGYQDPVFGRGYLKEKFVHGSGLFFPALTQKAFFKNGTPIPAKEDAVAVTFSFLAGIGDPSVEERAAYLKGKLQAQGAVPKTVSFYSQRGVSLENTPISYSDGRVTYPRQIIEFKFARADEDIARKAILEIDEAADGRISARVKTSQRHLSVA